MTRVDARLVAGTLVHGHQPCGTLGDQHYIRCPMQPQVTTFLVVNYRDYEHFAAVFRIRGREIPIGWIRPTKFSGWKMKLVITRNLLTQPGQRDSPVRASLGPPRVFTLFRPKVWMWDRCCRITKRCRYVSTGISRHCLRAGQRRRHHR